MKTANDRFVFFGKCAALNAPLRLHLTLNPSPEGEGLSSISEEMVASEDPLE